MIAPICDERLIAEMDIGAMKTSAERAVAEFEERLTGEQVSLPPEFQKMLHDNLWELYG